jgi:uncharacterized protein YjdB
MGKTMLKKIFWSASVGALLLFVAQARAETHQVTSTDGGTTVDGSFGKILTTAVSGDVIEFDTTQVKTLEITTLNCAGDPASKGKTYTILGNGVTISIGTALSLGATTASGVTNLFESLILKDIHFTGTGPVRLTANAFKLLNCTFSNAVTLMIYGVPGGDHYHSVDGCAFMGNSSILINHSAASRGPTRLKLTSCTFVRGETGPSLIRPSGTFDLDDQHVNFTNCVMVDKFATETALSVTINNVTSSGYNVIQGIVNGWTDAPSALDYYIEPTSNEEIIKKGDPGSSPGMTNYGIPVSYTTRAGTTDNDSPVSYTTRAGTTDNDSPMSYTTRAEGTDNGRPIYYVVRDGGQGKAYRHLPANTSIEGITFPEKDLAGNTIDYTTATHSGAWQAVWLAGDESEGPTTVYVTDIHAQIPNNGVLYTDTTYLISANVEPGGVDPDSVIWASTDTRVTVTQQSGTTATLHATGIAEETTVNLTATSVAHADNGQPLDKVIPVTFKPYIHVESITLTGSQDVRFGYTEHFTAAVTPDNANWKNLTWTVSDNNIAQMTVDPDGYGVTLKGLTEGTTTITATANDNNVQQTLSVTVQRPDYSNGVFIINEDWFGSSSGTVNHLDYETGRIDYRAFQAANHTPPYYFGMTAQYGTIYGDKFYVMSKQGARLTVADAKTLELHKHFNDLGGGDGRFFLGLDEHTGYVATSNGIRVVDLDNLHLTQGGGDPKIVDNLPHIKIAGAESSGGSLSGQVTTMKRVENRVFAIQQGTLLVIAVDNHVIETTFDDHIYITMTQSKDGFVWLGTSGTDPTGQLDDDGQSNYLVKLNPYTLERTVVTIPNGVKGVVSTFGAWQADPFCASTKENVLYWKGGSQLSGTVEIHGMVIYRYDIDQNKVDTVLDITNMPKQRHPDGSEFQSVWSMYGTAFGVHPLTDELFVTVGTFMINVTNVYERNQWKILRVDQKAGNPKVTANSQGNILQEWNLTPHYWFPAMPVFPDNHPPKYTGVHITSNITLNTTHPSETINLKDKFTDDDNLDAGILFTDNANDPQLVNANVSNGFLTIAPRKTIPDGQPDETTIVTLKVNSNGKIIYHYVNVTVQAGTTGDSNDPNLNPFELTLQHINLFTGQIAQLALTAPQLFDVLWSSTNEYVANVNEYGTVEALNPGQVYIVATDYDSGRMDSCLVTVQELPVDDGGGTIDPPAVQTHVITLSNNQLNLTTGQMNRLYVQLSYTDMQNVTLQWNSSDYNVADVTQTGLVIAKNPGTAAVTVMTSNGGVAVCNVTVTKTIAQPTVNDVGDNHANVQFTANQTANYYLLHVYQSNYNNGIPTLSPLYTLKVLADGTTVNTKSRNGNTITVDLNNLTQGNNCIVWIEALTLDELGNSKSVALETLAFTTLKATGNVEVESSTGNAYYQNGTLTLTNMQESVVTLFNLNGNTVLTGEVKLPVHTVHKKLQTGVYFLKQRYDKLSKICKVIVK